MRSPANGSRRPASANVEQISSRGSLLSVIAAHAGAHRLGGIDQVRHSGCFDDRVRGSRQQRRQPATGGSTPAGHRRRELSLGASCPPMDGARDRGRGAHLSGLEQQRCTLPRTRLPGRRRGLTVRVRPRPNQSQHRSGVAAVSSIEGIGTTRSAPRFRARWRTPEGKSWSQTFGPARPLARRSARPPVRLTAGPIDRPGGRNWVPGALRGVARPVGDVDEPE
jgi:hypothetical protein